MEGIIPRGILIRKKCSGLLAQPYGGLFQGYYRAASRAKVSQLDGQYITCSTYSFRNLKKPTQLSKWLGMKTVLPLIRPSASDYASQVASTNTGSMTYRYGCITAPVRLALAVIFPSSARASSTGKTCLGRNLPLLGQGIQRLLYRRLLEPGVLEKIHKGLQASRLVVRLNRERKGLLRLSAHCLLFKASRTMQVCMGQESSPSVLRGTCWDFSNRRTCMRPRTVFSAILVPSTGLAPL